MVCSELCVRGVQYGPMGGQESDQWESRWLGCTELARLPASTTQACNLAPPPFLQISFVHCTSQYNSSLQSANKQVFTSSSSDFYFSNWINQKISELVKSEWAFPGTKEFVRTMIFSLSPLRTSFGLCLSWTLLSTSSPSRNPLSPYTWIEHG